MTELTLQISVRLQEEGVPQELAREVAQLFENKGLSFFSAMQEAIAGLDDHYAQRWNPSDSGEPV